MGDYTLLKCSDFPVKVAIMHRHNNFRVLSEATAGYGPSESIIWF